MAPNDSRHLLPMNSMVFSRNKSNLDLSSSRISRPYLSHRATVTETALPRISEQDDDIFTALPAQSASNPRRKFSFWRAKEAQEPQPQPTEKSTWQRMLSTLKRPFRGLVARKARKIAESPPRILTIGSPTDFQHVVSGGATPLRGPFGQINLHEQQATEVMHLSERQVERTQQQDEQEDDSTLLEEEGEDADWETEYGGSRYNLQGFSPAKRRY